MKALLSSSVLPIMLVLLLTPAAGVTASKSASDSVHFCTGSSPECRQPSL